MYVVRSGNLYVVEINGVHYLAPVSVKAAKTWKHKGRAAFWQRYFRKFRRMEVTIEEVKGMDEHDPIVDEDGYSRSELIRKERAERQIDGMADRNDEAQRRPAHRPIVSGRPNR